MTVPLCLCDVSPGGSPPADYLGVCNEQALRLNFILVYELLDEIVVCTLLPFALFRISCNRAVFFCGISVVESSGFVFPPPWWCVSAVQDYGHVQDPSSEQLKVYVHNEPYEDSASGGFLAKLKGMKVSVK